MDDVKTRTRAPRAQVVAGAVLPPVLVGAFQLVLEPVHSALVEASSAGAVPGGIAAAA